MVSSLDPVEQVGIIPVLASLLGSAVREMAADTQGNSIPGGSGRLTELQVRGTGGTGSGAGGSEPWLGRGGRRG